MGLHKLEIEVTDELLSRIDSMSACTSNSRTDVILGALKAQFPDEAEQASSIEGRRLWLRGLLREASNHSPGLSHADILRETQEMRADE